MNFLDADYSAIEARIVNWLAGQEDALAEYRAGVDRYKRMASVIYGVPEDKVDKFPMRFIGKQVVLGCSYQMGPDKFRKTCENLGYKDMPEGLEETAVGIFRKKHKSIVRLWKALEKAAQKAILYKGTVFKPIPEHFKGESTTVKLPKFQNLDFKSVDIGGMRFLLMRLPSGRKLAYPKPRLMPGKFEGTKSIVFFGHIKGVMWGDVNTYAGRLCENAVQGIAADIMANGAHNAEREGYAIATLIHDQALAYHREGQTAERFVSLLTNLPEWAAGLPIEAEGGLVPFYRKD